MIVRHKTAGPACRLWHWSEKGDFICKKNICEGRPITTGVDTFIIFVRLFITVES